MSFVQIGRPRGGGAKSKLFGSKRHPLQQCGYMPRTGLCARHGRCSSHSTHSTAGHHSRTQLHPQHPQFTVDTCRALPNCSLPQEFEATTWPLHFAPVAAYRFGAAMLHLLPEIREVHADRLHSSSVNQLFNPYYNYGAIYGLRKRGTDILIMNVIFILGTITGLIMAANVADEGLMHDVSRFVLLVPFVPGPLFLLSTLLQWCLRGNWVRLRERHRSEKEEGLHQRIAEQLPELRLTTAEGLRLNHPGGLEPWSIVNSQQSQVA